MSKKLSLPRPDPLHNTSVNVRMTSAQKKEITEVAKKLGISASQLMRHFTFQALDHFSLDVQETSTEQEK